MSIERLGGAYIPVCDCCGEELATEYDFYDALAAVRAAGKRGQHGYKQQYRYCSFHIKQPFLRLINSTFMSIILLQTL